MSWLSRIKQGLSKSSEKVSEGIASVLTHRTLDDEALEELEDALIAADLGAATAAKITAELGTQKFPENVDETTLKTALSQAIQPFLEQSVQPLDVTEHQPTVILMVGVNGNGKTTSCGKLAQYFHDQGKRVMFAACDTFRAAAVQQLEVWGQRLQCPVITGKPEADPASVAFSALEYATAEEMDVLIIDTAGRLHTKAHLMDELEKLVRVLKKIDASAPHHTVLVLDATTGQNAHQQLEAFTQAADVSGMIVTKLDGTAKAGVVVSLADKATIPIHAIGVGEQATDLQPFTAKAFADNLVGLNGKA